MSARITNDWLPIPAEVLKELGWSDTDLIDLDVRDGVLVAVKSGRLLPVKMPIPGQRGKSLI